MAEIISAVYLAAGFLALFATAELLHRIARVPNEVSRKFLHVTGGTLSGLLPVLFTHGYMVLILAGSFFLLLWGTRKLGYLGSVHEVGRKTEGSILFPVPIFICFMLMLHAPSRLIFYLPIAILTYADPMAFWVGTRFPVRPYRLLGGNKTVSGTIAFAGTAFIISLVCLNYFTNNAWPSTLLISLLLTALATAGETVSDHGYDNLLVPLAVAGSIFVLQL